jgi:hypothetical protein
MGNKRKTLLLALIFQRKKRAKQKSAFLRSSLVTSKLFEKLPEHEEKCFHYFGMRPDAFNFLL